MTYYMAITSDEYELPLAVATSAQELAKMCGTTANYISCAICRKTRSKGRKFIKVIEQQESPVIKKPNYSGLEFIKTTKKHNNLW